MGPGKLEKGNDDNQISDSVSLRNMGSSTERSKTYQISDFVTLKNVEPHTERSCTYQVGSRGMQTVRKTIRFD